MALRRFPELIWGPNKQILERILLRIVEPILLYAAPIWITITKSKRCDSQLRVVQRLMLMTIIRRFRSISTKSGFLLLLWHHSKVVALQMILSISFSV